MKWEYATVMFEASGWFVGGALDGEKLNNRLNELGQEGWELVTVFDTNVQGGRSRDIVAVLKRPTR
jgi:hypothetical protein